MSADSTEQDGSGGEDLRARYLPVSRKELRRRREAELAAQREASEEHEAETGQPEGESEAPGELGEIPAEEQTDVALPAVTDADSSPEDEDAEEGPAAEDVAAEDSAAQDGEDADPEPSAEDEPEALPEPDLLLEEEDPDEVVDLEDDGSESDESESGEDLEASEETDEESAETPEAEPEEAGEEPGEGPEEDDSEEAPVPASRRARRLLRETDTFNVQDDEKLRELDEINQQVAEEDDPNRVDPELLKKQQAMAAKAMQANQERLRREQEEREEAERQERRRRRRERPESEVITRKALRAHMESDQEADEEPYATGEIEPVQARGAHGLELDEIVEHSSRQASRQSLLLWLVIILAVLLVVAVGIILYFVL